MSIFTKNLNQPEWCTVKSHRHYKYKYLGNVETREVSRGWPAVAKYTYSHKQKEKKTINEPWKPPDDMELESKHRK